MYSEENPEGDGSRRCGLGQKLRFSFISYDINKLDGYGASTLNAVGQGLTCICRDDYAQIKATTRIEVCQTELHLRLLYYSSNKIMITFGYNLNSGVHDPGRVSKGLKKARAIPPIVRANNSGDTLLNS